MPVPLPNLQLSRRVRQLGPGLITGAADDDPSGIVTYSQAGARFGYSLLWTVVLTLPLMVGIQLISARLGHITGRGLAANIRAHFPRPLLYAVVGMLVVANTFNLAADIAAMGDALKLVLGGSQHVYSLTCGLLCLVLQVFMRYQQYVRYLKWLTLALLSYVAVVFTIHVPWQQVMGGSLLPGLRFSHATLATIVAVFGTTLSPYLFFWQASQEVEEQRLANGHAARNGAPPVQSTVGHLRRIRWDTIIGMTYSNLVAFFIIMSAAATLHLSGVTEIESAAQAAQTLRPVAGDLAFALFTLGIIGTGMLAVPILAGSAAYAVTESMQWESGLDMRLHEAREFYGIIAVATLGGVLLNFSSVNPIKELLWSAMLNGVIAVPIMVVMILLVRRTDVMGEYVASRRLQRIGWATVAAMAAAAVGMVTVGT